MNDCTRKIFIPLYNHLQAKEHSILIGARQTGKSTVLKQIHNKLLNEEKHSHYLTLEDPQLLSAINVHPENIFDYIPRPGNERVYLLIDEVQYAADPSNFLKLLYDKYAPKLKIVATGSSAFYIDRKFKDSLAGRKQLFELFTLDFDEFIDFKTGDSKLLTEIAEIRTNPKYKSSVRKKLEELFDEYLVFGGYPAVVLANTEDEKKPKLKELVNTYIKRDIYESNIANELKFYNLMLLLANQTGSQVNINELANTLKLSVTAIDNYLYVLQKSFHVTLVRPFYSNIRKELTKMPKLYFNDTGLRNTVLNHFENVNNRLDKGLLIENYIYIRLRQLYGTDAIKYWRTADGNEVDFIISTAFNEGFAIEAKFNIDEFKPTKYKKFIDHYPQYELQCMAYKPPTNAGNIMAM
jgi:uncharacterized protein